MVSRGSGNALDSTDTASASAGCDSDDLASALRMDVVDLRSALSWDIGTGFVKGTIGTVSASVTVIGHT